MVKKDVPLRPPLTKELKIIDILEHYPAADAVLRSFKLPCADCVVAETETLEQGCRPHQLDPAEIIRAIIQAEKAAGNIT